MTADRPEITDAVLAQWERSAQEDVDADRPWSVNPKALLVALAELRAARAAAPVECPQCGGHHTAPTAAEWSLSAPHPDPEPREAPSPARFLLEGAAVLAAVQDLHRQAGRMSKVDPVDVGIVLAGVHQLSDAALAEAIERHRQGDRS